ncbi:MAG: MFS transporter [Candidatus Pacearchaeota archaeon]
MRLSPNMQRLFERNIILQYFNSGLAWGRFFIPVLALFYIASQVTVVQFSIIMSVFTLATFLLEIPTGIFADLIGKKKTLILSRACYVIEIAIIAFGNGFWPFLVAKIISGVGVSLGSGTSSAFLFDTLKRLNRTKEHKKIMGVSSFIANTSMACVFIIGAYLFSINPKLPAYVSLPFIIASFIIGFWLTEPYPLLTHNSNRKPLRHFIESFAYFRKNKMLQYLSLLAFVTTGAVWVAQSFSSLYLKSIIIPVYLIGAVAFVASLLTAYFSKQTHKIESYFGNKKSLFLVQTFLVISILGMALLIPYIGVLFYLTISFVAGTSSILISDFANVRVPSSHRATLLSMNNMFGSLGNTLLFPFVGYLTDLFSLQFALAMFGLFVLVYSSILYFVFKGLFRKL